jgi:hypothetical protein
MHKKSQKINRLKYIRALDKFVSRSVSYLKDENITFEVFRVNILKNFEILSQTHSCQLYSQYYDFVKKYINMVLDSLESDPKIWTNQTKDILIKESNSLHKIKNQTNYKKDKHRKKIFSDE